MNREIVEKNKISCFINRLIRPFMALKAGLWLQWQIESNWTDPFVFAIYTLLRPLSSAFTLVFMYTVVNRGDFENPYFLCLFIGSAFYLLAGAVFNGVSWGIIDDREHHKTLKYICISPTHLPLFLAGRGISNYLLAAISVIITMAAGILFLDVKIPLGNIDLFLFPVSIILGLISLIALGLLLGALSLLMAHHTWLVGDILAGSLFLFSGTIFPIDILPKGAMYFSFILPLSWWIELTRRALIGDGAHAFSTFSAYEDSHILWGLMATTALWWLASALIFPFCFNKAREKGWLDLSSNY